MTSANETGRGDGRQQGDDAGLLLLDELAAIQADLYRAERARRADLETVHPRHRGSARNMLHYLALRSRDIRAVQGELTRRGLSSLGRCEPCVAASLHAVMDSLRGSLGSGTALAADAVDVEPGIPSYDEGWQRIEANAGALLGPPPPEHDVRIMVTLPSEAAIDAALAREDATPLATALRERPVAPKDGHWATFVRNHDELTLDKPRAASRCAPRCSGPVVPMAGSRPPGPTDWSDPSSKATSGRRMSTSRPSRTTPAHCCPGSPR
ncbi:hypothetical protein [Frankia sp. EAN1pec]|uniref:hypothetical protein n=1 Tax=Parafrankia sp. (strain EAN1pec) TaxID=298653 RepID=UPI0012FC0459